MKASEAVKLIEELITLLQKTPFRPKTENPTR